MNECIFCSIIAKKIDSFILYEDETVQVFLDAFPVSTGHTLVVPKKHYDRFDTVPAELVGRLSEAVQSFAPRITQAVGAEGYNLGLNNGRVAGQAVDHVHWHIIPRFADDGLRSWPNRNVEQKTLRETARAIIKSISKK